MIREPILVLCDPVSPLRSVSDRQELDNRYIEYCQGKFPYIGLVVHLWDFECSYGGHGCRVLICGQPGERAQASGAKLRLANTE